MAFSIFREIRLSLLVGCDYRDYRDNRDDHFYEIDRNNPRSFDERCFAKHFAKQEGRFACFFYIGDRGP
jgi:hypothetical protein